MRIFDFCMAKPPQSYAMNQAGQSENWLKVFGKFKDYLLVSICDEELIDQGLEIFHNFLTSPSLKHAVYEECKESVLVELLYKGNSDVCKDKFRQYLLELVVKRTEDTDNALKKFFRALIQRFSEKQNEAYLTSNITDILEMLK